MTASSNLTAVRTTDSSDRTPSLNTVRSINATRQPKSAAARIGGAAKRFLTALMRSLATPHV